MFSMARLNEQVFLAIVFSKGYKLTTTISISEYFLFLSLSRSFFDLANIEILGEDNKVRLNIFNAKKRIFPLSIDMLEMHPLSSQVFLPLNKVDFIVLVAPSDIKPDLSKIEIFKISNGDGINFNTGVWHFPLISIQDAQFITIDKKNAENNIEIYKFTKTEKFNLNYE